MFKRSGRNLWRFCLKADNKLTVPILLAFMLVLVAPSCLNAGPFGTETFVAAYVGLYIHVSLETKNKQTVARQVRYYLERPKEGTPALILLNFSYKSARVQLSTEEYVNPEHWDKKRQRVGDRWCNIHHHYLDVNRMLDDLNSFVLFTYNDYRRNVKLMDLTPAKLRALIREKITGVSVEDADNLTVLDYYQRYLFDRSNDSSLAASSVNGEKYSLAKFEAFSKKFPGDLYFRHVNLSIFESYRNWLWKSGATADSTVHKHLRRFRQMCKHAAANGETMGCDINAISLSDQLKVSGSARDNIALYDVELEYLAGIDLSADPEKEKVRDLFLMGCYTGLRFNRWGEIRKDNLVVENGVQMLQVFTKKGRRKAITLPLHPVLKAICERYEWNLPKVPTGQHFNRTIKEICKDAGYTEEIALARNVKGRSVIERYKKYDLISTHTARRSFATNADAAGVPFKDIKALTGHSKDATLQHYIKEDGKRRAERLSALPWFKS